MKKLVFTTLTAALGISAVCAAQPAEGVSASTNITQNVYPCVDGNSRATFKISAPDAKDVKVDICSRKYDMKRDDGGMWSVTTDPLVEGFHYYSLIIDGVPVNDPSSETFFGCGKQMSGIEIRKLLKKQPTIRLTGMWRTAR